MDRDTIEHILTSKIQFRDGESVAIVGDRDLSGVQDRLQKSVADNGVTSLELTVDDHLHGRNLTPPLKKALNAADTAIILSSDPRPSFPRFHTTENFNRVRILEINDPEKHPLRSFQLSPELLEEEAKRVKQNFQDATRVTVEDSSGTDLTLGISPFASLENTGSSEVPGQYQFLPSGMTIFPVKKNTSSGQIQNGSLRNWNSPATETEQEVHLQFRDGTAVYENSDNTPELLDEVESTVVDVVAISVGLIPEEAFEENMNPSFKKGTVNLILGLRDTESREVISPTNHLLMYERTHVTVGGTREVEQEEDDGAEKKTPKEQPLKEIKPDLKEIHRELRKESKTFQSLFKNANDAQYVADLEAQCFLEVNPAMTELLGYSREELIEVKGMFEKTLSPESQKKLEEKQKEREDQPSDRYEIELIDRNGNRIPSELSVRKINLMGRKCVIGTVRDLTEQKELEEELREKLKETMKANQRILALTEKIQHVPELTSSLLDVTDENHLFKKAVEKMGSQTALGYEEITFYLIHPDRDRLEPKYTTRANPPQSVSLDGNTVLAEIGRGNREMVHDENNFLLPLTARDEVLGALSITLDEKECSLMKGNETAWSGYRDVLSTLSNSLGLIIQNRRLNEELRKQSIMDELTGLYNRRYFNQKISDEMKRARRYGHPLSLLIIDIDNFKGINDTYGHNAGDKTLKFISRELENRCRSTDWVFRYGGDEFLILLPETDRQGAETKADNLLNALQNKTIPLPEETGGGRDEINVSLSIGISFMDEENVEDVTREKLLKKADECMYQAKNAGGDRLVVQS